MFRRLVVFLLPLLFLLTPVAEAQTTTRVPNVVGKRIAKAKRIIRRADLTPRVRRRTSPSLAGIVNRQRPRAGRLVNEGRTVLLIVARGGGSGSAPRDPDCDQVNGSDFTVVGSDPHGFDRQ